MQALGEEMDRHFSLWALLVDPPEIPEGPFFLDWLSGNNQAGMDYLVRTAPRRLSLQAGYPGYRSIVIALLPHEKSAFFGQCGPGRAEIARYAIGEDYHSRFERAFRSVLSVIGDRLPSNERPLIKPDHGALMEKSLAQMAGLGVMGKNTLLINSVYGSWFTIGCLLLKTPLVEIRGPFQSFDPCGSCSRCLMECPTDAFEAPYHLDGGRCLSYLTIERPRDPNSGLRKEKGSRWLFGCDRCQEVCPHNRPILRRSRKGEDQVKGEEGTGGRVVGTKALTEETMEQFRKRNSALSRVSTAQLMERVSEIREWETRESASSPRSDSPEIRESMENSL